MKSSLKKRTNRGRSLSDMTEHTAPLSESEARHLLSRLAFSAPIEAVMDLVGSTAGVVVDAMLESAAAPLPEDPDWVSIQRPLRSASQAEIDEFTDNNRLWGHELRTTWIQEMTSNPLLGRLALFWHNHFVTSFVNYHYAAMGYNYLKLIRLSGQQNFKTFVHAMGRDAAMLVYLDGNSNTASAPNENYARELMELFTMSPNGPTGSQNYTENDIQEIARAFTGWRLSPTSTWQTFFVFARFDDGEKTVFGRTGHFNYSDIIDLLFEERGSQIAYYIAKKLYCEFVFQDPDEDSIAILSQTLLDSNFELRPVLRQLFTSQRFLDLEFAGSRVKSPVEHLLGHFLEIDVLPSSEVATQIWQTAGDMGQNILDPPNVAGWPGHRLWLTTDTLPERWSFSDAILNQFLSDNDVIQFGQSIIGPASTHPSVDLAVMVARHIFKVPLEWVEIPNIIEPFEGDLIGNPLPDWLIDGPEFQRSLVKMLLGSVPWYEFSVEAAGGPQKVMSYMTRLSQYPEYQLT